MQNFVGKTKCIAGYMKVANSGRKQKPQNFQRHKNSGLEIAACNAQWAIPGL